MRHVKNGLLRRKFPGDKAVSKTAISIQAPIPVTTHGYLENLEEIDTPSTRKLEPREGYSDRQSSWLYRGRRERKISISDPEMATTLSPRPSAERPPKPKPPKRKVVAGTVHIPAVVESNRDSNAVNSEEWGVKF